MMDDLHSFDICPLRSSSSLFIIDRRDRSIVTATDELFDMLGYEASDIIGTSIDQLVQKTRGKMWRALHAKGDRISLQVCIHHNPLQTTTELDYWLVRPCQQVVCRRIPYPIRTTTILLLSPVGIIDRVYHVSKYERHGLVPAPAQHQQQLVGKPIMAYIHSDDVQTLCGQLSTVYYNNEPSFDVRWLHQRDDHEYQKVTLTATKTSTRITCVVERVDTFPTIIDSIQQWAIDLLAYLISQWQQSRRYLLEFVDHATSSKNQHGWYSSVVQAVKSMYPPDGILTMLENWVDRVKTTSQSSFL
ncbi:hypothetical protein RO3G_09432 [Lichtheimia corymbifera JMRC:FSU:9682]|uniref:PAS domain-containing protein n=1 Tax=Lichtheimia corymbifera JMRC:FSU:9682 TaxID=1263082 RepID=A0A068RFA2_9FUNG|nr:hypothetical protein RO3G_09432 [Lichtheimia corymbifera JMRC:FSU:9682]